MDGTRMGSRSSTRHGPAAVFSGPVRRWRKTWAPAVSSSSSTAASSSSSSSRVLLYKWVPLTPGGKDEGSEEPITHTVRYMPVSIVLAQRKEASRRASDEVEVAPQENADVSGEPKAQAEASDQMMASAEIKASDSTCTLEEQDLVADGKDETGSEEKLNEANSPSIGDVIMTDEVQDQAEDVKPAQDPSGQDLETAQVPLDSSAGNEPEGLKVEHSEPES